MCICLGQLYLCKPLPGLLCDHSSFHMLLLDWPPICTATAMAHLHSMMALSTLGQFPRRTHCAFSRKVHLHSLNASILPWHHSSLPPGHILSPTDCCKTLRPCLQEEMCHSQASVVECRLESCQLYSRIEGKHLVMQ